MMPNIKLLFIVPMVFATMFTCSQSVNNVIFIKKISNLNNLKILILGNSITGAPELGKSWTEGWGMAASSSQMDYVHILYNYIQDSIKSGPQMITYNLAGYERNFPSYDFSEFDTLKQFNADLIIFRIGDNINPYMAINSYLWEKYDSLLQYFAQNQQQVLLCTSSWYSNKTVDAIMRSVCKKNNISFIDISNLIIDKTNQASSERDINNSGIGSHPGDRGMKKIADILWENISMML
jgi:hypothetical protein